MSTGVDPVEFGRLLQQTSTLVNDLPALRSSIERLEHRLSTMEGRFRLGKGMAFGLVLGLGFAAYGVKTTLFRLAGIE